MLTKEAIENALKEHWHIGPAAKSLNVGYSTLRKYIKIHGIVHNSRIGRDGPIGRDWKAQARAVTRARRKKKIQALEYKGGMECTECGFDVAIPDVYAFHHRDPKVKDPDWAKMTTNNWSLERILPELDKCDVLCHNCHTIIHHKWRMAEENKPI